MRIAIGNWLYNAGIVGFLRIMKETGFDVNHLIKSDCIEIEAKHLDAFEERYYKYLLRHMAPDMLFKLKNEYLKLFDKDKKLIESYLKKSERIDCGLSYETFKTEMLSIVRLFVAEATSLIKKNRDILIKEVEELYQSGDKEELRKMKNDIKTIDGSHQKALDEIKIKYEGDGKSKKGLYEQISSFILMVMHMKGIYSNLAVIGNPSGSKNRLNDFKDAYVAPAAESLSAKQETGTTCKFCCTNKVISKYISIDDSNMKPRMSDHVFNEGLFSLVGVSIGKFHNFFYNGIPDLFMCDVCKLILLCSFAGLNKKNYFLATSDTTDHIFVNMPTLELLIKENDALQSFYGTYSINVKDTVYEHIFKDVLLTSQAKKSQWALQNIFFVEFKPSAQKNTKPIFKYAHVGKDIAELFSDHLIVNSLRKVNDILILQKKAKGPLNFQKDIWVNIKSDAIKRLLENDSLYSLVYENLRGFLNYGIVNPYNSFVLAFVQSAKKQINLYYARGGKLMDSKQVYGILAHQYYDKGKNDFNDPQKWPLEKKQRMSYKLLSLIRTGKYADFYEALMKLYINSGKSIPDSLLGILNIHDTVDFEAKAYAFMTGFLQDSLQGAQTQNNNKEGHDE